MGISVFAQSGCEVVGRISVPDRLVYVDVRPVHGVSLTYTERDWTRWTVLDGTTPANVDFAEIGVATDALRSAGDPVDMAEQAARLDRLVTSIPLWLDRSANTTVHIGLRATRGVVVDAGREPTVVARVHSRVTFSVRGRGGAIGKRSVCRAGPLPDGDDPALPDMYAQAVAQAARLSDGADASPLTGDLVLSPHAAATVVHEVVGHLLEADNAAGGILGAPGDQVSPAPLSVLDRGDHARSWGAVAVDDEGVATEPVTLLRDGVVAGLLTDRRTAEDTGAPSNGHGRRAGYADRPLPRLSCLTVVPGTARPDALVGSVRDGLYVDEFAYGYVNVHTGATRLVVREARTIANGRLTDRMFNRGELRFDARSVLAAVTGIGDDAAAFPALCAKQRQELPVLDGGVSLLLAGDRLRRSS